MWYTRWCTLISLKCHNQSRHSCCSHLCCETCWKTRKPGCCYLHLSWYSICYLCWCPSVPHISASVAKTAAKNYQLEHHKEQQSESFEEAGVDNQHKLPLWQLLNVQIQSHQNLKLNISFLPHPSLNFMNHSSQPIYQWSLIHDYFAMIAHMWL